MWHEARKHSKKLRGLMVDHKKRAEKRKSYYDKIKKDPAEFLQIWGRQCKIHIDPNIASAADNPLIMTNWRGNSDIVIDRFDARFHLDIIEETKNEQDDSKFDFKDELASFKDINELKACNYERYRTIILNEADEIGEEQCLKQIEIEEKYGSVHDNAEKKSKEPKAQIGYKYEDSHGTIESSNNRKHQNKSSESDSNDESDIEGTIDVTKLDTDARKVLNRIACDYGMNDGDFVKHLQMDKRERDTLNEQKLLESQKAQLFGRQSRNERRKAKDNIIKYRPMSPLSYALPTKNENKNESDEDDDERIHRRTPSPQIKPKIEFISSFGAENEEKEQKSSSDSEKFHLNIQNKTKSVKKSINLIRREISMTPTRPIQDKSELKSKKPSLSSDSDSSDNDKELKEYLKRKQSRQLKHDQSGKQSTNALNIQQPLHSSINSINSNPNNINKQEKNADNFRTQREKLKKRMMRQLDAQYKKDKEIEAEKRNREYEERKLREANLNKNQRKSRSSSSSSSSSSSKIRTYSSSSSSSSRSYRRKRSSSSSRHSYSRNSRRRRYSSRSRSSSRYRRRRHSTSSRSSSRSSKSRYKRRRSRSYSRNK